MKKIITALSLVAGMGAALATTPSFAGSGAMACMADCGTAHMGCARDGTNLGIPGSGSEAADQTRANMTVAQQCAQEALACYQTCR